MNSAGPPNSGTRNRGLHEAPAENLRRAWQEGREPTLDSFLAGLPAVSPSELASLIRVDFEARWSRNDHRRPEEYLGAFSAVAADTELAVDVIYTEYLAREQSGERPELAEYLDRFPAYAKVLAEQILLHHALQTFDDDALSEPGSANGDAVDLPDGTSDAEASYEILELIGSGGMGVVYKARQAALNRFVALKMVRAIDADNPELLARFRSEARVVAALHHPHIVQVYYYGQHEGLPYIAMELIEGGSLADRLDGVPWAPRSAAELLVKLADAVQYAHERHVIHRDLKPANVLVASDAAELAVKITDFGLAKFLIDDLSPHTKSVAFLGTPSYMAPEQASSSARNIGPAADIYSLGAIFYELLTGQPPFRSASNIETLRLLLSSEPISIHRFTPRIPRDLATICDKCLQRDPNKRYSSAGELRADLERYLEGRPIQARPVGNIERAWRWCRRNPHLAGALGSVAMLLLGIAVVSLWYSARLSRELTKTRIVEQAAQLQLWNVYLSEASARNSSHRVGQRFAALESIDRAIALLDTVGRNSERESQLRNAVLSSVALPDIRQVRSLSEVAPTGVANDMSVAADCYVVASADGTLTGYRLSDGRRLWTIKSSESWVTPVLSRDGKFVASVGKRSTKVWRVDAPEPQLAWEVPGAQFLTFAPDNEHALYSDPAAGMRLVRINDGTVLRTIGKGAAHSKFAYHAGTDRIAVCGADSVQVIDGDTGKVEFEIQVELIDERRLAWHPSGEYLAVWGDDIGIGLWNVKTGVKVLTFLHRGMQAQLSFNSDGSVLASQSLWDKRLCVWDVGTGQRLLDVPEFISSVCDATSDRRIMFLTINSTGAALMELTAGTCRALAQSLYTPLGYWATAAVGPEGRIVAFSSDQGLELWDLQTTRRLLVRKIGPCVADFDRAGQLIIGCNAGVYRLPRHVETIASPAGNPGTAARSPIQKSVIHFGAAEMLTGPIAPLPQTLAVNARGEILVYHDEHGWALKHIDKDAKIIRLQTEHDPRNCDVSDDNRFVTVANWESGGATVWDAQSGKRLADLAVGRYGVPQFSPDSRLLAITPDGVTIWSTGDWRRISQLHAPGTTPTGLGLAFSPDSRVLAVGHVNGALGLVDPLTGKEWARISRSDLSSTKVMAFSPDQRWFVTSSIDERFPAQVWDLVTMRRELANRGLDLPADVLRPTASPENFEEQIEIVLDGVGLIESSSLTGTQESSKPAQEK